MNRKEANDILEDVIDTLNEVGNGTSDADLHTARDQLLRFRDEYHNKQETQIVGVAFKMFDGTIVHLPKPARHNHLFPILQEKGYIKHQVLAQGFYTDQGSFVGRIVGFALAKRNGQFKRRGDCKLDELFSEDLW